MSRQDAPELNVTHGAGQPRDGQRLTDARYRALLEAIDQGFCIVELMFDDRGRPVDYRFIEINPAFERQTGLVGARGKRMRELAPAHEQHWFDIYGRIALTGKSVRFENHAAALGDRWFDVFAFRVDEPDQRHVAILFSDITDPRRTALERQKAQQALAASEARFRQLIELGPVGIGVGDPDGRMLLANEALLGMLGYAADEIDSLNWLERTPPEYLPLDLANIHSLRRGDPPAPYEKEFVRRDGTRVAALVVAQFLPGKGERIIAYVLDITERKRTERALRESESQLRSLIDHMAGFVAMLDREGSLLEVGEPALHAGGLRRADVIGRKFWECGWWRHDPGQQNRIRQWVRDAGQGTTVREDVVARTADGGQLDIDLMLVPVLDDAGRVTHVIPSGIDVSERKRMETALRENEARLNQAAAALQDADQRKDEFLATLAHELRNPLAPIRNGVQILRLTSAGDHVLQRTIEMMDRQVNHLVRLVDDLLDVGRITRGKIELRRERVVLNDVLSCALESCETLFEPHGHELRVQIPPEPLAVEGDPDRLTQVFSNLLSNAAKFTPREGTVWLSLERQGGDAVVVVRDTGIGIPAERLESVFDMFAQVHTPRGNDGLGIGLALARRLLEMHRGSVTAESAGLDQGSQLTVRLPLLQHSAEHSREQGDAGVSARTFTSGALRVLVVDDNVDAAESLGGLLKLQGHDVTTCTTGTEAVALARREPPPDLVFMDLGMPRMDGVTAARLIRAQPGGEMIRIVALTGWGQDSDRQRTREAGFDEHLVKPVSLESLRELLAH
jgi:PAS domain S-box-containing protein